MARPFAPVGITGTGVLCCAGRTREELWRNAIEERSGLNEGLGRVPGVSSDAVTFALTAAREAMAEAGWTSLTPRDGILLATTTGQIPIWDRALVDFMGGRIPREEFENVFVHQPLGVLLDEVASQLGGHGPSMLVTSACAASTQALGLAALWLEQGQVDRCLVIGVEVLCTLTTEGFKSLQLLSPENARPFDERRKGINLSEGAAAICLETAGARANWKATLSGFGMSCDGYHMTGPQPEGLGVALAIDMALETARLKPSQISWVHAHGTGSPANDLSEGHAIAKIFGDDAPWVTSTKWLHGHALGASGALETVLCVQALREQTILRTGGLESPDPLIQLKHPTKTLRAPIENILKTTLGFGGVNAAIILGRVDQ